MRRPPPSPPERPAVRHRTDLTTAHATAITEAAADAGVPASPWLAWARLAADLWGPEEATRRACAGARTETAWTGPEASSGPRRPSWWRHRG